MPSERFFRLDKAKQEKIKEAAKKEFLSHPMEDVSINRIVKDAEISRGSFYTYFEDKQDAFTYLLRERQDEEDRMIRKLLEENGFDFDDMLEKLLIYYIEDVRSWQANCWKLSITPGHGIFASEEIRSFCDDEKDDLLRWIWQHIEHQGKRIDFDTFAALAMHFRLVTAFTAIRVIMYPEDEQKAKKTFHDMIRVFKEGV